MLLSLQPGRAQCLKPFSSLLVYPSRRASHLTRSRRVLISSFCLLVGYFGSSRFMISLPEGLLGRASTLTQWQLLPELDSVSITFLHGVLSPVLRRGAWSLARILSGSGMATLQPLVPPKGQGDGGLKKTRVGWRGSSVTVPPGAGLCGAVEDTDTLS